MNRIISYKQFKWIFKSPLLWRGFRRGVQAIKVAIANPVESLKYE